MTGARKWASFAMYAPRLPGCDRVRERANGT
jgi:hypothetical protein